MIPEMGRAVVMARIIASDARIRQDGATFPAALRAI
jgi:hypothetical protein